MSAQRYAPHEALAAVRLAREAGARPEVLERVMVEILSRAPDPEPGETASVDLLIDAVRAARPVGRDARGRFLPAAPHCGELQ
jgi:hypothetical protein